MDDAAATDDLVALGLTKYEAKSYLALIGRDGATPAEVARMAGIPRQRVYDVLASLAERGLVAAVPGRTQRYAAQPPDQVMDRLLAMRRQEFTRMAEATRVVTEWLLPRWRDGRTRDAPLDYVEVLRDVHHAVNRVEQLWSEAEVEVLTLVRPPYLSPPTVEDAVVPTAPSKRALYELSLLDNPELSQLVETYAIMGEEIRLAPSLPMKLTIIDRRSVAFNMPDPVTGDAITTLVVHHEALATTLRIAFETIWDRAVPLHEAHPTPTA